MKNLPCNKGRKILLLYIPARGIKIETNMKKQNACNQTNL